MKTRCLIIDDEPIALECNHYQRTNQSPGSQPPTASVYAHSPVIYCGDEQN